VVLNTEQPMEPSIIIPYSDYQEMKNTIDRQAVEISSLRYGLEDLRMKNIHETFKGTTMKIDSTCEFSQREVTILSSYGYEVDEAIQVSPYQYTTIIKKIDD